MLLTSCNSTESFSSDMLMSSEYTVDEKLLSVGSTKIMTDLPTPYYNGEEFLERITDEIEKAEDYILIMTFLGSSSPELEPFYSTLIKKAQEGVDVYMVIDGISSFDMTESKFVMTPLDFLKDGGVHLLQYSPLTVTHLIAPQNLIQREHRKMFVIDGEVAVIGGMNINYISMGSKEKNQRDSMYVFNSPTLAKELTDEFVSIWNSTSVDKIDRSSFADKDGREGKYPSYLFNQGPGGVTKVADMYSALINSAEDEILFVAFVPMLDDAMLSALKRAKDRGVEITAILSVEPRNLSGVLYKIDELREAVTTLYYAPSDAGRSLPLLHEKLMIVDSRYTVIGSTNFNYRSMTLSNELSLVIDSYEFALFSKEHFYDRVDDGSEAISYEDAVKLQKDGSLLTYVFVYYGG